MFIYDAFKKIMCTGQCSVVNAVSTKIVEDCIAIIVGFKLNGSRCRKWSAYCLSSHVLLSYVRIMDDKV